MAAIENATLTTEILGIQVELELEYSEFEKLKYYAEKNNIQIVDAVYENTIKCYIEIPKEKLDEVLNFNKVLKYNIVKNVNIVVRN